MADRDKLSELFEKQGFTDFKWIEPKKIEVARWVRMKCLFGCAESGKNATCPPNVPSIPECREFFAEYETAALFHFGQAMERPEDRHLWTREVNTALLDVERAVFLMGFEKAFLLFMDSCYLCDECAKLRKACKQPRLARPSPESMGVDVFTTARRYGYPIEVLTDYTQTMNRYAILLIE